MKIKTLEDFLRDQCGMITPKLLKVMEPHREFIETQIQRYDDSKEEWDEYCGMLWDFYLPELSRDVFEQ